MGSELSVTHKKLFDEIMQTDDQGNEYWSARDLQQRLGYATWENFEEAIERAKTTFEKSETGATTKELFRKATKQHLKTNQYGEYSASKSDYHLDRGACYVIAQNADPSKPAVAAAQIYFAVQTYRQELNDEKAIKARRDHNWKRMQARDELTIAENGMTRIMLHHGVTPRQVAAIRSNGDAVLFGGNKTADMKKKLGVPGKRALADFLTLALVSAKTTAASLTAINTERDNLQGFTPLNGEHVKNNKGMREYLIAGGVTPEEEPADTDIRQIAIRLGISNGPRKPIAEGQLTLLPEDNKE